MAEARRGGHAGGFHHGVRGVALVSRLGLARESYRVRAFDVDHGQDTPRVGPQGGLMRQAP